MNYAYARVSATDQNLERQYEAFKNFGIDPEMIYADKKSGKDFNRKAYRKMLKKIRPGDLIVIKSIDRLGRNYDSIIEEWSRITGALKANILVLDMPLLDTRSKADSLVGKFISDIVLQVLSFVAENERVNIRARQAEGIAAAKARGVVFGRPKRTYTDDFIYVVRQYLHADISLNEATERLKIKKSNFYYHLRNLPVELVRDFDLRRGSTPRISLRPKHYKKRSLARREG